LLHFCKFFVAKNRKEEELVPAFRWQDRLSSKPTSWEEEEERRGKERKGEDGVSCGISLARGFQVS
jgi:hypothetical protein